MKFIPESHRENFIAYLRFYLYPLHIIIIKTFTPLGLPAFT